VPLDRLLQPGTYTVRLSLDDARQGARADAEATFVVQAPASAPAPGEDAGSGLAPVIHGRPEGPPVLVIEPGLTAAALGTIGLLGLALLGVALRRRRRAEARRSLTADR